MAKGKRTPALFEIINRAQIEGQDPHLQVPGWWRNFNEQAETDKNLEPLSAYDADPAKVESDRENYEVVAEAVEQAAAEAGNATEEHISFVFPDDTMSVDQADWDEGTAGRLSSIRSAVRSIFHWGGGKMEVSLGMGGLAIAGVASLAILSVSFAWGHALGKMAGIEEARRALQEQAEDSVEAARKTQAQPSVLDVTNAGAYGTAPQLNGRARAKDAAPAPSAAKSEGAPAPQPPSGMVRQVGWNYLVVQTFRGPDSLKQAKRAERFILGNLPTEDGMPPVTIEQLPNGGHALLSTMGYPPGDVARKEAVASFKDQIRRVGKLYQQQGGGYDFKDAYPMRLSHAPKRRD